MVRYSRGVIPILCSHEQSCSTAAGGLSRCNAFAGLCTPLSTNYRSSATLRATHFSSPTEVVQPGILSLPDELLACILAPFKAKGQAHFISTRFSNLLSRPARGSENVWDGCNISDLPHNMEHGCFAR